MASFLKYENEESYLSFANYECNAVFSSFILNSLGVFGFKELYYVRNNLNIVV